MNELKLLEFAEQAEVLVGLPDLDAIERRGHDLRSRRRVGVVAAAVVLLLLGTWLVQYQSPKAVEPVRPDQGSTQPYPGVDMQDLEAGTYLLTPTSDDTEPAALITVPAGWNSWQGPNRFNGHRPGDPTEGPYNEPALGRSTWYVGVLVVEVLGISSDRCGRGFEPDDFVNGYQETVRRMRHLPGYRMVVQPGSGEAFGFPAVHLNAESTQVGEACGEDGDLFVTSNYGTIGGVERAEIWVVDVDGTTLVVFASSNGDVPPRFAAELDSVVGSIEFQVQE